MRYSISGPRELTEAQEQIVYDAILGLQAEISGDPKAEFWSGAQVGADTVGVEAAVSAGFKVIGLTVPIVIANGGKKRAPINEELLELVSRFRYRWEILTAPPGRSLSEAYLNRNDLTIAHTDIHITAPKTPVEELRSSGTWSAIRRARKAGCEIRFHPLDGSPSWTEPPRQMRLGG